MNSITIDYNQQRADQYKRTSRRITNAIPIVAGLTTAALTKGKLSNKMASGAIIGLGWGAVFGAIDLLSLGERKAAAMSQKVRDFKQNNPMISLLGSLGMAYGVITLMDNKIGKALSKITLSKKNTAKLNAFVEKIDTSKFATKVMPDIAKTVNKLPAGLKSFGKWTMRNAPIIMIFASLGAMFNGANEHIK